LAFFQDLNTASLAGLFPAETAEPDGSVRPAGIEPRRVSSDGSSEDFWELNKNLLFSVTELEFGTFGN
jgi:hypothetical protein